MTTDSSLDIPRPIRVDQAATRMERALRGGAEVEDLSVIIVEVSKLVVGIVGPRNDWLGRN